MKKFALIAGAVLLAVVGLGFVTGCINLGVKDGNLSLSLRAPELPNIDLASILPQSDGPTDEELKAQLDKANEPAQEERFFGPQQVEIQQKPKGPSGFEVFMDDLGNSYDVASDYATSRPWWAYALLAAAPLWIGGFFSARKNLQASNPTKTHWQKKMSSEKAQDVLAFFGTTLTAPVWLVFYLLGMGVAKTSGGIWNLLTVGLMSDEEPETDEYGQPVRPRVPYNHNRY